MSLPSFHPPSMRRAGFVFWMIAGAIATRAWASAEPCSETDSDADRSGVIGDAWSDPRNPIARIFGGERLDLWSLRPFGGGAASADAPAVADPAWVRNPIDAFVLARLESAGLRPAPEADRRTLIRRLSFGLTGLPPTPDEVDAFLADEAPDAYERLVDRLLASPRYGEHWGRQWLDVVRYGDSNGFDWDEFRKQAWRFRDYVIRAFNADKPFDRFIIEQLAGDELLDGAPPRSEAERDCLIATGYLRLGPHDNSAALFNEQGRGRAELMFDLVETTGSAFLGLTLSCARCHDHKFDPISQADYFRLRAFFEPVAFADETPLDLAKVQDEIRRQHGEIDAEVAGKNQEIEVILGPVRERLRMERRAALSDDERALLDTAGDDEAALDTGRKQEIEALEARLQPSDDEVIAALDEEARARHDGIRKAIETLESTKRSFEFGLLATDREGDPDKTFILEGGDYRHPLDEVSPGFLSVFDPGVAEPAGDGVKANAKTTGRRLALARWIASPANPFTARVLVNRVWQGHFGRGIVATPNDFGLSGAPPSHPGLLDWLAGEFVRTGWSLKRLHRIVATSAAYRQASSVDDDAWREGNVTDSDNAFLWRQNLRRLSAEQLRDALLAVSGRLIEGSGGPPIWPELPPEVLQANPAFLDDNETRTKGWYPSPPEQRDVRSVYLVQKRTVRVPFMETFDLPDNSTSCGRRTESVVAPQALSLLNGPLSVAATHAFVERVARDADGDAVDDHVRTAFRIAVQRDPDPAEAAAGRRIVEQHGLADLCRVLLNVNEFVYVD